MANERTIILSPTESSQYDTPIIWFMYPVYLSSLSSGGGWGKSDRYVEMDIKRI